MGLFRGRPATPEDLVLRARGGDTDAREELLRRYQPFVLRIGSRVTGRFLRAGQDDEFSIGMLALNEAIDRYDASQGAGFLSFCEMVVRRRLVDHYRRESGRHELPWSALEEEDEEGHRQEAAPLRQAALDKSQTDEDRSNLVEEIERFRALVEEFGLTLSDLVEACPKHRDARESALRVARLVADDPLLSAYVRQRHELPLKALENRVTISRKTLERQRKYILATSLVWMEGLQYLEEYVKV